MNTGHEIFKSSCSMRPQLRFALNSTENYSELAICPLYERFEITSRTQSFLVFKFTRRNMTRNYKPEIATKFADAFLIFLLRHRSTQVIKRKNNRRKGNSAPSRNIYAPQRIICWIDRFPLKCKIRICAVIPPFLGDSTFDADYSLSRNPK